MAGLHSREQEMALLEITLELLLHEGQQEGGVHGVHRVEVEVVDLSARRGRGARGQGWRHKLKIEKNLQRIIFHECLELGSSRGGGGRGEEKGLEAKDKSLMANPQLFLEHEATGSEANPTEGFPKREDGGRGLSRPEGRREAGGRAGAGAGGGEEKRSIAERIDRVHRERCVVEDSPKGIDERGELWGWEGRDGDPLCGGFISPDLCLKSC
jgi:hypothetical protein